MLTPRQNFIETVTGGTPDRYVKQFEFFDIPALFSDPWNATNPFPAFPGDPDKVDFRGITWSWPADQLGAFPVHGPGRTVLDDVTEWESVVKNPPLDYSDEAWEAAVAAYNAVDRTQHFAGPQMFPGILETLNSLMGMEEAFVSIMTEEEATRELIDFIVEWECDYIKQMAENLHFDIVFHHDDWGSRENTFFNVDMLRDFFLKPYQKLYGCYRDNGAQFVVHHSDTFGETLVPTMIEMGIDVWQGAVGTNDLPGIIERYDGQISIMSGIESFLVDKPDWSVEEIGRIVDEACGKMGTRYFVPCQTQGGPGSAFEGVYEAIDAAIDAASARYFG